VACTVLAVLGLATSSHAADAAGGNSLTVAMAVLLGAVQGVTEFLPISSDGHLALGQALLHLDPASAGHRFTIAVHGGTLLAVLWTYRADLIALLGAALRPTHDSESRRLLIAMLVASVPLGLVLLPGVEDAVVAMESQIRVVGVCLWFTGLVLWIGFRHERLHPAREPGRVPTPLQALLIGLAQVIAVLPGVSRSGMTISAALLLGLDRAMAARFSFLISVIAVSGAVAKEVLEVAMAPATGPAIDPVPYAAGFATALVVGLFALRGLILLVGSGRIGVFVIYLALLGAAAIALG
jgi:undecaprenyl-diphosphatase